MIDETDPRTVTLAVTATELQLIRTSLRFLLEAEDDPESIERLKRLIERLGER